MACESPVYENCPVGHPMQKKCKDPKKPCSKCEADRKAKEKKAKEDFEHVRKIAELDDEIKRERDVVIHAREAEDNEKAIAQKKNDLQVAKESARVAALNPLPPVSNPEATSLSSCAGSQAVGTKQPSNSDLPGDLSSARARWERQKSVNNEHNDSIDAIMAMTGLEQVKEQILAIKDKKDVAIRQGTDLRKERFNVAMLGNPGTGKISGKFHPIVGNMRFSRENYFRSPLCEIYGLLSDLRGK
jgi:hypothetical protein